MAGAIGVPLSHVLLNESHDHSAPALPGYYADWYESDFKEEYFADAPAPARRGRRRRRTAALQPARIGCGWGESTIGVYRRELRDGRGVLGEVPDHPIDPSVGVIRVDDLDGTPIAVAFRYSAHPVTVGGAPRSPRRTIPGPARDVLERNLGGLALFLQGCGGNINPRVGIGYEVDCRDTKNRVGLELGGEALKIAARIRTNTRAGERRPLGNVPNILFTPWEPVHGATCTHLTAAETTVALDYVDLPSPDEAQAILARWQAAVEDGRAGRTLDWELRVAVKMEAWARRLLAAVEAGGATFDLELHAIRVNDIVIAGMNVETFFETGPRDPRRLAAAGHVRPRLHERLDGVPAACRGPPGRRLEARRALRAARIRSRSSIPGQVTALHPDSEQRALEGTLALIRQLTR